MKHVLFVMYFAIVGGEPQVTSSLTTDFPNLALCQNAGKGHEQIATSQKVVVMIMCSPKEMGPSKAPINYRAENLAQNADPAASDPHAPGDAD